MHRHARRLAAKKCQMFNAEIFILRGRLEHRFDLEQPVVTPGYEPATTVSMFPTT